LALITLAVWFHRPALTWVGHLVVYEDSGFENVDAVVILPGAVPDRAFQVAELVLDGKVQRVFLNANPWSPRDRLLLSSDIPLQRDLDVNRLVLLKKGVSEDQILVLPGESESTWEDAQLFLNYSRKSSLQSVAIVTCKSHSYRAFLNYEKVLEGSGIQIHSVPSRYCEFDPDNWWLDRDCVLEVYLELTKLAAFVLGWA
jgi:uncharacterized SAM-binding protein YcdF (DUF218 family)